MKQSAKLPLHKVVPLFTLPDKYGQPHNLAKQRGREHLLLLIFRSGVDAQQYLQHLARHAEDWRQLPARGIVVVGSEDAAGTLGSLPFTILIDSANKVYERFLPETAQAGIFALDRYADLYQQWLVAAMDELPTPVDVSGWMQAIAMQCNI
ncbi:MAG TPA: hypothetical protein VFZ66_00205 [Herpetosiphonaceae bacterium]